MRKTFTTIALFAVLGTLAVSCQKENIIDETSIVVENGKVYTVSYTVNGVTHQLTLVGDNAWHDFLNRMFALAEEGHEVSFRNDETASRIVSAKEVVTYSTKERDKDYAWADAMVEEGYSVTISFDRETGIYTREAVKQLIANRVKWRNFNDHPKRPELLKKMENLYQEIGTSDDSFEDWAARNL